jgi:hypothetical protein
MMNMPMFSFSLRKEERSLINQLTTVPAETLSRVHIAIVPTVCPLLDLARKISSSGAVGSTLSVLGTLRLLFADEVEDSDESFAKLDLRV